MKWLKECDNNSKLFYKANGKRKKFIKRHFGVNGCIDIRYGKGACVEGTIGRKIRERCMMFGEEGRMKLDGLPLKSWRLGRLLVIGGGDVF
ncbi:hypothetical protein CsSME_00027402 [Camellia sinensis var. sinensis]